MYVKKDREQQKQTKFVSIEDLVPQNHVLRDIDKAIDFSFIYQEVKGLYSEIEWGKPGIDPVSLFKIVFIQYLFGVRSMRQTIKEIEVNMAYRWFMDTISVNPSPTSPPSVKTIRDGLRILTCFRIYSSIFYKKQLNVDL